MLAIRMQRTGRKGFATYRIVVQDIRQTPTSGRVVAQLGNYNPHTKEVKIDTDKCKFYIDNGAHPSDRVITLLKKEGVKMPKWVDMPGKKKSSIKNTEKLRKNRPAEVVEEKTEEPTAEAIVEPAETAPSEEPVAEKSAPEAADQDAQPAKEPSKE